MGMADPVNIFTRRYRVSKNKPLESVASAASDKKGRSSFLSRYSRVWRVTTVVSSTILRVASFVFLRWIPGHHLVPTILLALFSYLASFLLSSRPLPVRTPEEIISDRYTAAYERLQLNRRRRDTEEYIRWQRDDEGLRRRQGNHVDGSPLSQDALEWRGSSPGSPLMRSPDLSETSQSLLSIFPTPSGSLLPRASAAGSAHKRSGRRRLQSLPCASDTSPAGITETMILGLPNPASRFWSILTLLVNLVLTLMVFDLVLRAPILHPSHDLAFARTGYVDEKSARILVREPDPAQMPLSILYRAENSKAWTRMKGVSTLGNDQDYTHAFTLAQLKAATLYEYSASNGLNGSFSTAPRIGSPRLTFLSSSCLKARVPYNLFQHPLQMPGLDLLATLLPKIRPSFMLFLGDFIYVDVPWRLGWHASNYRREYRQVYASPSWKSVGQTLPWVHVIDDHEIANDWDQGISAPYPAAIDPYTIYHHSVNPPPAVPSESFYTFQHGPASFFLLDTRRHRTPSLPLPATHPNKTMLGAHQRQAVLQWLTKAEPRGVEWKILVSSVPFTRNWRANAMDTWAGYLYERQIILEAMWEAVADGYGVIILSGDRHEFAATRFPAPVSRVSRKKAGDTTIASAHMLKKSRPRWGFGTVKERPWRYLHTGEPVNVYEFSCSPLSMFYLPIRTYKEKKKEESGVGAGGEDQEIVYLPVGNSKVGAIDIGMELDGMGHERSVLRYRLFVDGEQRWAYGVHVDGSEGADIGADLVSDDA